MRPAFFVASRIYSSSEALPYSRPLRLAGVRRGKEATYYLSVSLRMVVECFDLE